MVSWLIFSSSFLVVVGLICTHPLVTWHLPLWVGNEIMRGLSSRQRLRYQHDKVVSGPVCGQRSPHEPHKRANPEESAEISTGLFAMQEPAGESWHGREKCPIGNPDANRSNAMRATRSVRTAGGLVISAPGSSRHCAGQPNTSGPRRQHPRQIQPAVS